MALVNGSRAVFDEGVSTPRRMGLAMKAPEKVQR
jgi:hypothetical protein